ncbi:hypothetical protein [Pararobbsia silviterrae]|uniref:hypothetical protein n=1 Tax=Pararobbsia silviterrae TaxID=1792498 RepID=UPI0011C3B335|nr:hypothetical protein [Pararobbsia silviterrae]
MAAAIQNHTGETRRLDASVISGHPSGCPGRTIQSMPLPIKNSVDPNGLIRSPAPVFVLFLLIAPAVSGIERPMIFDLEIRGHILRVRCLPQLLLNQAIFFKAKKPIACMRIPSCVSQRHARRDLVFMKYFEHRSTQRTGFDAVNMRIRVKAVYRRSARWAT